MTRSTPPRSFHPAYAAWLLLASIAVAADTPPAPSIPTTSHVKKWEADVLKFKTACVKHHEDKMKNIKFLYSRARQGSKGGEGPKGFEGQSKATLASAMSRQQDAIAKAKAVDYSPFVPLPINPKIGDIGVIGRAKLLNKIDDDQIEVELSNVITIDTSGTGQPKWVTANKFGHVIVRQPGITNTVKTTVGNLTGLFVAVEKTQGGVIVVVPWEKP